MGGNTKYMGIMETDGIRIIRLKKGARPMITKGGRLYRADDRLFIADRHAADALLLYRIDSTQPILCRKEHIDTDLTRALIDSAKLSGNKKKSWLNLDRGKLWQYFAAVAVIGSLLYGFLAYGGF